MFLFYVTSTSCTIVCKAPSHENKYYWSLYFLLIGKLIYHWVFKRKKKKKKNKYQAEEHAELFNSFHCIRIKVSPILFLLLVCEAGAERKKNSQKEKHRKVRLQLTLFIPFKFWQVSRAFLLLLKNYIPGSCRLADNLQELVAVSIQLVNSMGMSANKVQCFLKNKSEARQESGPHL